MGVLRARVGGAWVDIPMVGAGGGTDEVWIGPDQPTDPNIELWADTDENGTFTVPVGGTAGQVLTKKSATDFDLQWSDARKAQYFEKEATADFGDQNVTWTFTDSWSFPVETIAMIRADVCTTGWAVGFHPSVKLYSNTYGDPWAAGQGFNYTEITGEPLTASNIGSANPAIPLRFAPLVGVEKIPANAGIAWSIALFFHNSPGAIPWKGGYHVCIERMLITP